MRGLLGSKGILRNLFFGLVVCLTLLLSIEGLARVIPERTLPPGFGKVPALSPVDRGSILLRRNGYRGKRPCKDCPDGNTRIVAIGGSSTFGIPMPSGDKAYSGILQRLLDQRRPGEPYEVLNAGIPGFGIWQIIEALERVVLADKPKIVILCAWFNDSSHGPGWYGYKGLSDFEAYQKVLRLRAIEQNVFYKILKQSRAYAILRGLMLSLISNPAATTPEKIKKFKRSSPQEFRLGIERFIELSRTHQFQPIFLFEPLNRTLARKEAVQQNRYYRVLEELGAAHAIPIVDSLTPLAAREGEWLFYDFIHPNEHGHEIIAEAVYQTLFPKQR